jgi:hypothetical protein
MASAKAQHFPAAIATDAEDADTNAHARSLAAMVDKVKLTSGAKSGR